MLTSNSWDQLAQAALWARTNAATLIDSHWIGGNPNDLEIYGWASWSPPRAFSSCAIRRLNPASISLDIGHAFELPPGAATRYDLVRAYPISGPASPPPRRDIRPCSPCSPLRLSFWKPCRTSSLSGLGEGIFQLG